MDIGDVVAQFTEGTVGRTLEWLGNTWLIWASVAGLLVGLYFLLRKLISSWLRAASIRIRRVINQRNQERRTSELHANMRLGAPEKLSPPSFVYKTPQPVFFLRTDEPPPAIILEGDRIPQFAGPTLECSVDVWDQQMIVRHIELRVAVPAITDEERQEVYELASQRPAIMEKANREEIVRKTNRRASIAILGDLQTGENEILAQIVLREDKVLTLFVRCEEPGQTWFPLFREQKQRIDPSSWVQVFIDHADGETRVRANGRNIYGRPIHDHWGYEPSDHEGFTLVRWPERVKVRLGVASESARPVAFFTKPVAW